uniref:Transmembrane epididymal protein 1 n=1 Tax=Ailuropoda melanoleuca TaxID=9646 RepID=G1MPA5_AILME
MGKFIGHLYPGLYIFYYGLYQASVVFKAMIVYDSLLYPSWPPRNKGIWARLWKISYGGLLKMVTGSILTVYVVLCLDDMMVLMDKKNALRFMYPKEWQHLTMFILLTLNGCVDVMSKNLLPRRCVLLEKCTLALMFYVLLLLLTSHVQDSTGIELQTHCLLILVVFLLMLTFLFLMMGSWLIQVGFILYKPVTGYPWQDDDISDIMFVTTFFCWHVMINNSGTRLILLCYFAHGSDTFSYVLFLMGKFCLTER